ncbi:triphosphoribosyl-dephospho-CoA synthase [Peptoniphilus equinus]|uniref:triphosphoribosyl-dephospho-CoA synthase n=1 Tax=Peptoniphilus equinus TaxID=3016343 RepID=A0ABY7QUA5_9FIRM|nr:triphosphoribosyl-dephospho-CoA synthase [Peptoniphilus equinus]WBW49664.1 triphosphoribosyl-dephospho-CoA synthase [Peptoniphilus equinus]
MRTPNHLRYIQFQKAFRHGVHRELSRPRGYGCVTYTTSGAHRDMTHDTFLASTDAILRAYGKLNPDAITTFDDLRAFGRVVEADMFRATGGVNTHKGLIFLTLFIYYTYLKGVAPDDWTAFIREFAAPLNADYTTKDYAHGELCDVRRLPLSGFAAVLDSLPLRRQLDDDRFTLYLLSTTDDTTTVARSDVTTLRYLQRRAGAIYDNYNENDADALNALYNCRRISSGGVADIFTLTTMIERLL